MSDVKLGPQQIAELADAFLESDFGKHYIQQLQLNYNTLHHEAESQNATAEQKAFLVERAAGVKFAIDYLFLRRQRVLDGEFAEDSA